MSLAYTLNESISGFKRAKLSTFVSVVTVCISLLLLGVFAVLTINASRVIEALRNKVEMEAFLQEPVTPADVEEIAKRMLAIDGIESVLFVSKDEAALIFKEEFGEDIHSVLDFNPLPPSFKIALREDYKTSARAQHVYDQLINLKGVESIIYRKALLEMIDKRTSTVHDLTLGLGLLISLSSIFLVSNTIRLAIHAKRRLLRTMELVGATRAFIRLPFLLEGVIQGCVGGLVAAGLLYLLLEHGVRFLSSEFSEFTRMPWTFYGAVLATGMGLGLIGSIISVARFIRLTEAN
jgi:cell division transport system permease protein